MAQTRHSRIGIGNGSTIVDHKVVRCIGVSDCALRPAESVLTVEERKATLIGDAVDNLSH